MADDFIHALFAGSSGAGKSTLAYFAPTPILALLLDKSSIDVPPGVDISQISTVRYPPAAVDLSKDDHGRARNIADSIIRDIQAVRDHFTVGTPLMLKRSYTDKEKVEIPTPKTVVLEGGDFLAQHILNLVCKRHNKANPSDFNNSYEAWGLRLAELHAIYDMLTYLPCNVVVTTGLHKESRTQRINGKVESEETGVVLPDLGGAMCEEGPRKFHSSLLVFNEPGKYRVRTCNSAKHRGFKLGGKWGAPEIIDVTLDNKTNPWQKLFTKEEKEKNNG